MSVQIYNSLFKEDLQPLQVGEKDNGTCHLAVVIHFDEKIDTLVLTAEMEDRLIKLITSSRKRNERMETTIS